MTDRICAEVRSRVMSAVRARDTRPERFVRTALHAAGFRFRLHKRELPGRPDIVLPRYGLTVFVHGCFWHGHDCPRGRRPTSNRRFWNRKLDRNAERDRLAQVALRKAGWSCVTIWECSLAGGTARLLRRLARQRSQARATEFAR